MCLGHFVERARQIKYQLQTPSGPFCAVARQQLTTIDRDGEHIGDDTSRFDHYARGSAPIAGGLPFRLLRHRRRPYLLRGQYDRHAPARGRAAASPSPSRATARRLSIGSVWSRPAWMPPVAVFKTEQQISTLRTPDERISPRGDFDGGGSSCAVLFLFGCLCL
jgi:hypothetical protein